ncbi:MAG: CRTAC1 family protein [Acidobacteria bacterium]|nr:CRTAC1 family protein [Acidobacteriota bacterium]MYJ05084.1 CRTAC1 family protein [Acidobacteriota bacterium]
MTRSLRLLLLLAFAIGCGADRNGTADSAGEAAGATTAGGAAGDAASGDWFVDRAAETGLRFVHRNGATGRYFYPEILPPGVGLFDYDNDGDLDAYLAQGHMLDTAATPSDVWIPTPAGEPAGGRLFRNELVPDGALRFTDVTEASGIATGDVYGLGIATGDVDNDGWIDLLLTNFGPSRLYRNNGDGSFTDTSRDAGIAQSPEGFGVSAAFVDYDRDSHLDLYVGYNVNYTLSNTIECTNVTGAREYCPPETYGGMPDRLYRNTGGGRFVDVSDDAITGTQFGPALGVVAADYDNDGWMDIYVANDATENILWINQGDGTFRDEALLAGAALNDMGLAEASMGVDAGDFDNDGDEDLFMTHITSEGNNLYVNDGEGGFADRSTPSGLGAGSLPYTGWGTTWMDYDNDGWLDLLAVNGTIMATRTETGRPFPYDQRKTLFRNLGDGTFIDVSAQAGAPFARSEVGRGAAFGDVDNDGDTDVLIGNDAGPAELLINQVGARNQWIGLRLVGDPATTGGRDLLGARIALRRDGQPTLWRRVRTDGSYASANDPRVVIGLGASDQTPTVEVIWPDGTTETWGDLRLGQYTTLQQGTAP